MNHCPLVLAVALLGCGARTAIESSGEGGSATGDDTGGRGEASATTDAASSSGQVASASSTGAGGAPTEGCTTLAWAGEPVFIRSQTTPTARSPHLAELDGDAVALVFEEVGGGSTLVSVAIDDAWGDWPVTVSPVQPNYPVGLDGSPVAVAPASGAFAFATADGPGTIAFGTAHPSQNGSTFAVLQGMQGRARWLTPTGPGGKTRLLGHGSENILLLDRVSTSSLVSIPLGAFACADAPLVTGAVAVGEGFLVASAGGHPFDDCIDPDVPAPPTGVQTVVVREGGSATPGAYIDTGAIVDDVVVAARPGGGAWLAWQNELDDTAHIVPVAADGKFEDAGLFYGLYPDDELALLGWGTGLATVTAGVLPDLGVGVVLVQLFDEDFGYVAHTVDAPLTPLLVRGRPTVVASRPGRSFLVAVETVSAGGATIALLRADCAL